MQVTRTLGDQGNGLHLAHIAKVIDALVRSRPSPARCRTVTAPTPRPGVAICCSPAISQHFGSSVSRAASQTENATAGSGSPADAAAEPFDRVHAHSRDPRAFADRERSQSIGVRLPARCRAARVELLATNLSVATDGGRNGASASPCSGLWTVSVGVCAPLNQTAPHGCRCGRVDTRCTVIGWR